MRLLKDSLHCLWPIIPQKIEQPRFNLPIENVSWHEAAAFANAMSIEEGFEGCYTCTGVK